MKKITLFIVLNLLSLTSFCQFKKELVYTSELNTNLKEWVDEYSKLKTQIQEVANLQQRIDSNNSKMVVYESDCAKSNGFNCNYYSIKQYNAYRERDLYQITDKTFIIKILKELNLNKKSIDLTSSYLVKGDNAGIESVYLKNNISGIWMCMEFLNSDQKESLMILLLKNDILSMTEESKVNALKTLTGLDDKYFSYLMENYEYTEKIKTFNKTQTSIENSKYKYIGSFNTNGTKKWGILFDGDNDTLFIGKWFNNFPDLESGKSFLYNNTENVVILEGNGLVFKSYIGGKFYVGSMKDNVANGLGFVLFNNGDRYLGSFLNGRYNGNGILYKNGDRYNGNFLDGKKSGQGFISFEYGGWYDGEWKNDMYDGMGELGSSDGQKSIGLFSQNVFVKSKEELENEYVDLGFVEEESTNNESFETNVSSTTNKSNSYSNVTIGEQVWMTANLSVKTFRNGEAIPEAKSIKDWQIAGWNGEPAYCYYNFDVKNEKKYGILYNWYAVSDPRGLAPEGWHIPSKEEWEILSSHIHDDGSQYDYVSLKSTTGWNGWETGGETNVTCPNCVNWNSEYRKKVPCHKCLDTRYVKVLKPVVNHSGNGTNALGFSALPGGILEMKKFETYASFWNIGNEGFWWSSTKAIGYTNSAYDYNIGKFSQTFASPSTERDYCSGLSIRCIKD